MKKGDVCEGIIERYDFPNKGSFQVDERKVTIKGALPGQKVKYMVTKKKSGMAEGKVLEVLERSPLEDVEPTCPYFGACGGCAYQTMSYDNQLKLKADMVKALLDRVLLAEDSNSKDYEWEGILGSPSQTAYRNKMEFTFGDAYKDGPLALGLHQKGSFYDILTVDGCEIIGADWSRILTATLAFFSGRNVPFFHRMRHEVILRNLVVRQSRANGQFLINLVTSTQWDTYGFDVKQLLQEFVEMLLELEKSDAFTGSIAGILYTENDALGDVVQSDRMELLYGQDYIEEEILGLKFKISPFSFFQTNTGGCEVLYEKARDYIMRGSVKLDGDKTVFDLYSGTGTIAQMMAAVSKKVIGIEIVEEAVEAAKENGISVVAFDSNVTDSDMIAAFRGTDNTSVGKLAGEKLADAIGKSGKVAIFSAQEKTESSRRRVEGFKEAISAYSDISVVQELYMDKVEDMQSAIESTLQSYPDLAGVFCTNADVSDLYLDTEKTGDHVLTMVGVDATSKQQEAIRNGVEAGVVSQDPYRIGYQTILAAVQLTVPKEEVSGVERTVLYDPAWIDSSSLDDPEYSAYLYTE